MISAAGRIVSIRPTLWPVNGTYSWPSPLSTEASKAGNVRRFGGERLGILRPALVERGAQNAGFNWPIGAVLRRQERVQIAGLDRVGGGGTNQPTLPLRADRHLYRSQKAGPHRDALCTECQGSYEAAAVGDAARGDDWDAARNVDHLRHKHHRAYEAAVATGLGALGDDDVDATLDRAARLIHVHDLLDPECAGAMGALDQFARVTHVVRDRGRLEGQGGVEGVWVEGAARVVDRERPGRALAQARPLILQIGQRPNSGAEAAQGAGFTDGSGEVDFVPGTEWGADDGNVNAEDVAESGSHGVRSVRWLRVAVTAGQP
jgi:hypothetical protein